jgi:hypothetical protein
MILPRGRGYGISLQFGFFLAAYRRAVWRDHSEGRAPRGAEQFSRLSPMRIDEIPVTETHVVKSSEAPGGIGEAATAIVGPAVSNAMFAATGKRILTLPIDTHVRSVK